MRASKRQNVGLEGKYLNHEIEDSRHDEQYSVDFRAGRYVVVHELLGIESAVLVAPKRWRDIMRTTESGNISQDPPDVLMEEVVVCGMHGTLQRCRDIE